GLTHSCVIRCRSALSRRNATIEPYRSNAAGHFTPVRGPSTRRSPLFLSDQFTLVAGILLLIGILSSKRSARLGLPVLILFLLVGMLAGEEGIGQIVFDNFVMAHAIGTVALSLILFDGGLQTQVRALQFAWKPAALLATAGVLATAVVTGLAAAWFL